jgi:RNA polymerase sigma factor (sigma-70 family)
MANSHDFDDILGMLDKFHPLFLNLVKNPIKKESKSTYQVVLTYEEEDELLAELQAHFIQLLQDFNREGKVHFDYYIKEKLGWFCHNYIQKVIRQKQHMVDKNIEFIENEEIAPPSDFISEDLLALIHQLTPKQQEIIKMIYIDQIKVRAISEELGITEGAVNKQRFNGLKKLRKLIAKKNGQ